MRWRKDDRGWKGGSSRIVNEEGGAIAYVVGRGEAYSKHALLLAAAPLLLEKAEQMVATCPDAEKSEEWWKAFDELRMAVDEAKGGS